MMIVVTGATGNVGRPLIDLLLTGGARVRAVSRDPKAAALPAGVAVVGGDPSRPDTLAGAFDGADAVYLNPRTVGRHAAEFLALAGRQGVRRVVVQAAINVDDDVTRQPSRYLGDFNREAERAAVASGLEWVSLRPTVFAVNSAVRWAGQIVAGDTVRGPNATATSAPVHERDVAAVAARALLSDDLLGRRPELTGPESLTDAQLVATIGDVIGRRLRYAELPVAAARQAMVAGGVSEDFVDALLAMQATTLGTPAVVTGEVPAILGRPALTFARWAADHASRFTAARPAVA
ncbi:MAG TPA: NAD(P)H-binding protein [Pseudonocardiaceae bacterium]|jgi:uncharacterized protein YbjT (DUF2867 family)|nr:NAD(P)H-binding protein [Pseudonocardiaceae bacterium]